MGALPNFHFEKSLWEDGIDLIAGVDEVGRGPLAGPVTAGAVVLPSRIRAAGRFRWLGYANDSKQLLPEQREELAGHIWEDALAAAVSFVSVEHIDRIGIAEASRQAMLAAIGDLRCRPQHLLIDGFGIKACALPQTAIIDGDALSRSIACASIIAKVARDRLMRENDVRFPLYGFASNKGYATPSHMQAIFAHGPCDLHRRSFAPVRQILASRTVVMTEGVAFGEAQSPVAS